jgi:hypothetical protein
VTSSTSHPQLIGKWMAGKVKFFSLQQYPDIIVESINIMNDNGWYNNNKFTGKQILIL